MHEGRTYIVTGVASGIGARTYEVLKEAGATVIGVDRNATDNADQFFQADLGDAASIDALIDALPSGANGLANIAGVPPTVEAGPLLRVNLYGLQRLTVGLVPKLADGASIANLASLAGFGWAGSVDQVKAALAIGLEDDIDAFVDAQGLNADTEGRSYKLSKEALIVWTIQTRWQWRDRGITMNCASPGPVETPILQDFIATLGERAKEDRKVMDRPGHPDDIAPVVSFLLSDQAKWFRGANLNCDGGMSGHILSKMTGL